MMLWGWGRLWMKDPDGHEPSLYRAGHMRLQKPAKKAAPEIEKPRRPRSRADTLLISR